MEVTGGWRVLAPFRFREYRLLIGALSLSIFAEGMWAVVMAMQVIALDDDPTSLSLVATCLGAGLVAFVLVGGIAADRIDQRAIIIAVEADERRRRAGRGDTELSWRTAYLAIGRGSRDVGHRSSVLLPRVQCNAAADPARRALAGGQRRRGRRTAGIPARCRTSCGRSLGRRDVPRGGRVRRSSAIRGGPSTPGHHPACENCCTPARPGKPSRAAGYARWISLHAGNSMAAVDAAVREHLRAAGTRPHRRAAALHCQRSIRRRRSDVRPHSGRLRDRQRDRCAHRFVGSAATSLPHGNDGDVGRRLVALGDRRLDVVVPVDGVGDVHRRRHRRGGHA